MFRCLGCLLSYSLGLILRWHQIAILAPIVPFTAFIWIFFIPESPTFLLYQQKEVKSKKALLQLFGPQYDIDQEVWFFIFNNNLILCIKS